MLGSAVKLGEDLYVNVNAISHVEVDEEDDVRLLRVFFLSDSERNLALVGSKAEQLLDYLERGDCYGN